MLGTCEEGRVFVAVWSSGRIVWSGDENGRFTENRMFEYYESSIMPEKIQDCVEKIKSIVDGDNVYYAADIEPVVISVDDQNAFRCHLTSFAFEKFYLFDSLEADNADFERNSIVWENSKKFITSLIPVAFQEF